MYTSDKKMLELYDLLKEKGKIISQNEFCEYVGILRQNFYQIKNPDAGRTQHFTPEHIENACRKWKVNANWIFGTSKDIFSVTQPVTLTD